MLYIYKNNKKKTNIYMHQIKIQIQFEKKKSDDKKNLF